MGNEDKTTNKPKIEEMKIERVFNAPKEIVFKAWTRPEFIMKWWGPKGFSGHVIKVDFKKGGKYLYAMKDDKSGKIFWSGGEFKEINKPDSIILVDYFTDDKGNKLDPKDYGMDPNFPKESIITIKFKEENNKTKLSVIYKLPESNLAREAIKNSRMDEGWNFTLDKLQDLVERDFSNKLKFNPYLIFHGNCREAMEFYQTIFGGYLKMQKYSETRMPNSYEDKDKIIHAYLENEIINLMASDDNAKSPVQIGNNVQLSLSGSDEKKLTELFNNLSIGGKVYSPLKKEFWGDIFGMFSDKFGVHWMISISPSLKE